MKTCVAVWVAACLVSAANAGVYIEFSGVMDGNSEGENEMWRWVIGDSYAWEWFENCEFTATDTNAGFLQGKDLSKLKLKTGLGGLATPELTWFRKAANNLSDHRLYTGGEFEILYDNVKLAAGECDCEVDVDYLLNQTSGSINGQVTGLFNGQELSGADFAAAFNGEHDNNQWKATILSMSPVFGFTYETTIRLESQDVERHADAFVPDIEVPVMLIDAQVGFDFDTIPEAGGNHVSAVRKLAAPTGALPEALDPLSVTQHWSIGSTLVDFRTSLSLPYDTNLVTEASRLRVFRRADAGSSWQAVPVASVAGGRVTVTNVTQFSEWIVGQELSNDPVLPADMPEGVTPADRQMYTDWVEAHKAAWGASDFHGVPAADFLAAWLLGQKPVAGYEAGVSLRVAAFEPVARQPCETNGVPVIWRNGGAQMPEVVRVKVELRSQGTRWSGAVNGNLVIQSASSVTGLWATAVGQTNGEARLSFDNGVAEVAFNRPSGAVYYRPVLTRDGREGVTGRMLPWGATLTNQWLTCTVDDVVTNGLFSSLAFTAAGGLGICYYDDVSKDLKYASYADRTLTIQTVDTEGNVGQFCDLAFDAAGRPAISYYDDTLRDLKYASYDGSQWTLQRVDTSGTVGRYTSLAFMPNGQPAISYQSGSGGTGKLKYTWFTGTEWTNQTVDSSSYSGYLTSLAFVSGQPRIAFHEDNNYYLKIASYNGTSWSIANTLTRYSQSVSLALSPSSGNLVLAVFDYLNHRLLCQTPGVSPWSVATVVEPLGATAYTGYASLAFGPDNRPAISYYDDQGDNLKYAKYNGTQWELTVIDSAGDVGAYTSLAFSPSGLPAISYFDRTNGKLKIAQLVEVVRVGE